MRDSSKFISLGVVCVIMLVALVGCVAITWIPTKEQRVEESLNPTRFELNPNTIPERDIVFWMGERRDSQTLNWIGFINSDGSELTTREPNFATYAVSVSWAQNDLLFKIPYWGDGTPTYYGLLMDSNGEFYGCPQQRSVHFVHLENFVYYLEASQNLNEIIQVDPGNCARQSIYNGSVSLVPYFDLSTQGWIVTDAGPNIIIINDGGDVIYEDRHGSRPVWSPNGENIAYITQIETGAIVGTITIMDKMGQNTQQIRVRSDVKSITRIAWSPTGEELLVTSDGALYIMNLETKAVRLLIDNAYGGDWH